MKFTLLAGLLLLWVGLVAGGFLILGQEEYRPAPPVLAQQDFPKGSSLALNHTLLTLVLFAHPRCPCTQATFEELDRLRAETLNKLDVTVVFTKPPGLPAGWEKGSLWKRAERMKGIRIFLDINGIETRRFNVTTSGHVLVYAQNGRLLYSGGITASRGHVGDNPGESAIVQLTQQPTRSDKIEKPVFGCTLL